MRRCNRHTRVRARVKPAGEVARRSRRPDKFVPTRDAAALRNMAKSFDRLRHDPRHRSLTRQGTRDLRHNDPKLMHEQPGGGGGHVRDRSVADLALLGRASGLPRDRFGFRNTQTRSTTEPPRAVQGIDVVAQGPTMSASTMSVSCAPGDGRARLPIGLEEDAFARAPFNSIDGGSFEAAWHGDARVVRVGHHGHPVTDVADAVIEHDEELGTVIDAQPGARAAVLIDPHSHRQLLLGEHLDRTGLENGDLDEFCAPSDGGRELFRTTRRCDRDGQGRRRRPSPVSVQ